MPFGGHEPIPESSDRGLKRMAILGPIYGVIMVATAFAPMPWFMRIAFILAGLSCFSYGWSCMRELSARKRGLRKRSEKGL